MRPGAPARLDKRAVVSLLVVWALVAVQLYIYSPWHRHPQGRQLCSFNPVEHNGGVQPTGALIVEAPLLAYCGAHSEAIPAVERAHFRQLPSRAPPA
ncbi:MAG: hypothetical protein IT159_11070 [Bryobacterales bacterium]|nr:hypothetical protein [Bryobacterales bacterium]